MTTATRPYIVTHTASGQRRLVTAPTAAAARGHVTRGDYTVKAASASETLELVSQGVQPEQAGREVEGEK